MFIKNMSMWGRVQRSTITLASSLCLLCILALLYIPSAHATFAHFTQFGSLYPASNSDNNAGCQLCHQNAGGGPPWNAYGWAIRMNGTITAVENLDSDGNGHTNIQEINASTQPGWCNPAAAGCVNLSYNANGTTQPATPPTGIPLDPAAPPAEPNIGVSPTSLNFGSVLLGNSASLTTTISNTGTANLNVSAFNLTGSSNFAVVSPTPPVTIAPSGNQTVTVSYTPNMVGADSGTLGIASNDPDTPNVSVSLAGNGQPLPECNIGVTPASVNFGTVTIGNSNSQNVTVNNTGTADCVVQVAFTAGTSSEYMLQGASNFTVNPGSSQSVTLNYMPADQGTDLGGLDVTSNDPDTASVIVDLTGTGQAVATCNIDVAPTLVDFGMVTLGNTATQQFTVSNTGDATCTVSSVALTAGTSGEFMLQGATSFSVAPGASQTVSVDYMPADLGTDNGGVNVQSDDPATPSVIVDLTASGQAMPVCNINVSPASLDFGTLTIGTTGSQNVTVNNAGSATCTVSSVALTAGTSSEYVVQGPTSFSVAPGASQSVAVDYTPADVGTDTGGMNVASDDPANPSVVVNLNGTGQQEQQPPVGGEALYNANCAGCHGDPTTAGPAPAAPRKVPGARECSIHAAIYGNPSAGNDTPFPNGVPAMQFLQGALTATQIQDISTYLNSFAVTGQQRFITTCAGCHGMDARGGFVGENVRGENAKEISKAISEERAMRFLGCLPSSDRQSIGNYLTSLGGGRDDDDDDDKRDDDDDDDYKRYRR